MGDRELYPRCGEPDFQEEPSTTEGEQLVERFWQEFAGEGPITDRVARRMVEWVLAQPQEQGERIERGWAYRHRTVG